MYINSLREKFSPEPGFEPGSPPCRAGNPGSNPGPGENFSLKLTTRDLPDAYSENQIFLVHVLRGIGLIRLRLGIIGEPL